MLLALPSKDMKHDMRASMCQRLQHFIVMNCIIVRRGKPDTCVRMPQAWGLNELQAGNARSAVHLIRRGIKLDPSLKAVLRWKQVQAALAEVERWQATRHGRVIAGTAGTSNLASDGR